MQPISQKQIPLTDTFWPRLTDMETCGEHEARAVAERGEINLDVAELQGNG